ncbi:hypothetical protein DOTSEDRAFT_70587 [Dothistroma septosporum NZE10]|uniref:Uncharacterized protein n=1 Tax=Dothistroma septosporum (strain NZE10 / CBS 128990) TaxID=675120 RepID=N1PW99_DOTSN|nr:hypothetical protein DOTSEDRAFT_70587 [Dothistroma septosporum NZE10]
MKTRSEVRACLKDCPILMCRRTQERGLGRISWQARAESAFRVESSYSISRSHIADEGFAREISHRLHQRYKSYRTSESQDEAWPQDLDGATSCAPSGWFNRHPRRSAPLRQ